MKAHTVHGYCLTVLKNGLTLSVLYTDPLGQFEPLYTGLSTYCLKKKNISIHVNEHFNGF